MQTQFYDSIFTIMKIALILLVVALGIYAAVCAARVIKENSLSVSCGTTAGLIGGTAVDRDRGIARADAVLAKSDGLGKKYSAEQIESMLDAVYVHGIGKSFEEIRDLAYAECMKNKGR